MEWRSILHRGAAAPAGSDLFQKETKGPPGSRPKVKTFERRVGQKTVCPPCIESVI